MAKLSFETKINLTAIAQAFRQTGERIASIYNFLINWRVNRLASKTRVKNEIQATKFAKKINGKGPSDYAPANHTHDEYYRFDDTVEVAQGIYKDGNVILTEELALVNHEHEEYAKRDEFKVAAKTLEGMKPEDFALKSHEHPEYIKSDEIVDAAEIIGGLRYSDFAQEGHSHQDEYYLKTETVDEAMFLVDPDNPNKFYSAEDFAPKEHNHKEYYTIEEFLKLFLLKNEPYWVSDEIEVTVVDVVAGDSIELNETRAIYELLQSPYSQAPQRPAASVNTVVQGTRTTSARVIFVRNIGIAVGRYITFNLELPVSDSVNILGVFPAIKVTSGTQNVPVQLPVIGAFNNGAITIFAPPFRSGSADLSQIEMNSGSVLVDLMIIAECRLNQLPKKIGVVKS